MAKPRPKARTFPSVLAGLLLLLVPFAFAAGNVLTMAEPGATLTLGSVLKGLITDCLPAEALLFYLLPLLGAIVAFSRKKGWIFLMALLFCAAWGYFGYTMATFDATAGTMSLPGDAGTLSTPEDIQGVIAADAAAAGTDPTWTRMILPTFWALAWLVFAIVTLVSWISGKKVKLWFVPFLISLVPVVASTFKFLKQAGGFVLFTAASNALVIPEGQDLYLKVAMLVALILDGILSLLLLFWGLSVGLKPRDKHAVTMVDQLPVGAGVKGTAPVAAPAAATVVSPAVAAPAVAAPAAVPPVPADADTVTVVNRLFGEDEAPASPAETKAAIAEIVDAEPAEFRAAEDAFTNYFERELKDIKDR